MTQSPPSTTATSPFHSAKGDHVGLRVADLDAALAWYGEKLEFRHVGRTQFADLRYEMIAPAHDESFRIELVAGPGATDRPPHKDLMGSLAQHGWHHVCLRVDDVDAALVELKRRGVKVLGDAMDVPDLHCRCGFLEDPWGNVIELLQSIRN